MSARATVKAADLRRALKVAREDGNHVKEMLVTSEGVRVIFVDAGKTPQDDGPDPMDLLDKFYADEDSARS